MVTQKQAIAGCALWLAASVPAGVDAFSARSLLSRRDYCDVAPSKTSSSTRLPNGNGRNSNLILMAGFPPPMGGPGPGGPPGMGRGPPPGGMGQSSMGGGPSRGSYNANNPPGGPFNVPNAGNTAGQPRQGRGMDSDSRGGLGAIASGVSTPMDKYANQGPTRRPGGYGDGPGPAGNRGPGPNQFEEEQLVGGRGGSPGSVRDSRGGYDENRVSPPPRPDGRPNNLRYEERDYGEYVTNLRSSNRDQRGGGPPSPMGGGQRDLEDEVERLRKENDMLKRTCKDLMNNFNELSNRLFDVDETLKNVAKVFPSEDEMESLEWLLRR